MESATENLRHERHSITMMTTPEASQGSIALRANKREFQSVTSEVSRCATANAREGE